MSCADEAELIQRARHFATQAHRRIDQRRKYSNQPYEVHLKSVAALVAESIVQQVEKRVSHKRAMKQAVQRAMRLGAKGVRIAMSGRLAGSEMARHESAQEGRIPRHTLRAEIDYATDEALTTYGRIGVKVWIYKGEKLPTAGAAAAE